MLPQGLSILVAASHAPQRDCRTHRIHTGHGFTRADVSAADRRDDERTRGDVKIEPVRRTARESKRLTNVARRRRRKTLPEFVGKRSPEKRERLIAPIVRGRSAIQESRRLRVDLHWDIVASVRGFPIPRNRSEWSSSKRCSAHLPYLEPLSDIFTPLYDFGLSNRPEESACSRSDFFTLYIPQNTTATEIRVQHFVINRSLNAAERAFSMFFLFRFPPATIAISQYLLYFEYRTRRGMYRFTDDVFLVSRHRCSTVSTFTSVEPLKLKNEKFRKTIAIV
uniref:Uncharacterized protein n=1 Tax=Sipha flava TaxID=143950 RepID=A0A2S2Q2Z1_9HEMI